VLAEEARHLHRRAHAVGFLAPAVALVGEEHVLHGDAALLQRLDDLLGFDDGNVGVVFGSPYSPTEIAPIHGVFWLKKVSK
jgi:hypothetical protein